MIRWIVLVVLGVFAVVGFAGCKKRMTKHEGGGMTVLPKGASPGMVVRVSGDRPVFAPEGRAKIEVGGEAASISRVVSTTEADVLVPNVRAGMTTITVSSEKNRDKQSADFTVLPARAQQLVLKWKEGALELVATHATSGEPSGQGDVGGEPLLSFDVLNAAGVVIYTGAIPHPTHQRMEVFDGPNAKEASIRREKMAHETTFTLKVPKVPGEATVKFFEAPAGLNLFEARARERRKYVGEIKLKGGDK